jgi:hypothetical protein
MMQVRRELSGDIVAADADNNVNVRLAQHGDARTVNATVGVFEAYDNTSHARVDDCLRARSSAPGVATRLQRAVQGGANSRAARRGECDDLCVGVTWRLCGTSELPAVCGHHDGAHPRIRTTDQSRRTGTVDSEAHGGDIGRVRLEWRERR